MDEPTRPRSSTTARSPARFNVHVRSSSTGGGSPCALAALGVGKGDRVVLYMPMVPEAVFGMLACARLGAIHSVVFGGFAAHELAVRIDDARPKVVLSARAGSRATG